MTLSLCSTIRRGNFDISLQPQAMDDPSGGRLTGTTPDNHQPWLWFSQFFFFFCVASAGGLRFWIKQKYYGMSDVVSLVAHVRSLGVDLYRGENSHALADAPLASSSTLLTGSLCCSH